MCIMHSRAYIKLRVMQVKHNFARRTFDTLNRHVSNILLINNCKFETRNCCNLPNYANMTLIEIHFSHALLIFTKTFCVRKFSDLQVCTN